MSSKIFGIKLGGENVIARIDTETKILEYSLDGSAWIQPLLADATTESSGLMSSTDKTTLGTRAASGANSDITSLSGLTTALSVAQGGTGLSSLGTAGQVLAVNAEATGTFWTTVSGSGSGDVTGPSSSTDSNLVTFDGTTGKIIKDSGVSSSSFATAGANSNITSLSGLTTPLSVTQGGTGLNGLGTAGQVLAVNSGATGLEFVSSSGGLLIASGSGYVLNNGSTGRGTIGTKSNSLEYSDSGSTYGAIGNYTTVSGGYKNTASNTYATVSGGNENIANNSYATVCGGDTNTASGDGSVICGGYKNTASSYYSTIAGGHLNLTSGSMATVGGGENNTSNSTYATVGGGEYNTSSSNCATVGGGSHNTASGVFSVVVGGEYNTAAGSHSFSGGYYASSPHYGGFAWSAGKFSALGDCQRGSAQARKITSSTDVAILYLDGSSEKFTLSSGNHYSCRIHVLGAQADGSTGDYYAMVKIKNVSGTTSLSGTVRVLEAWEGDTNLGTPTISITADDANDCLQIAVTPANATATRWSAVIEYIKINY